MSSPRDPRGTEAGPSARVRGRLGREPERKSRCYALGGTVAVCTLTALAGSIISLDAVPLEPLPGVVLVLREAWPDPERPLPLAPLETSPVETPPVETPPGEKLFSRRASPLTVPEPPPVKPEPEIAESEPEPPAPPGKTEEPKPEPAPPKPRPPKPRPAEPGRAAAAETPAPAAASQETAPPADSVHSARADGQTEQRGRAAVAALMAAIEKHKKYSKQARRVGAEGTTYLAVTIGADGRVAACSLDKPGAHPLLDRATEQLGKKLMGLETPGRGAPLRVLVPVRYSLKEDG